ncbi:TIGR04222 domain-containing membrane protein [Spirillospora sp. NPDC047279]|uniref:TIGR04222 domain-containing membrane protein n=1 Tax=Spirillospora sp. NPDC047279 TaxID=3155478 RepID=UPI0033C53CEA
MPLAAAGDTWGIAGPVFLWGIFLPAAVALTVIVVLIRRTLATGHSAQRELHPYEVAHLTGGRVRVIGTVLAALRAHGAIEAAGGGRVRVTDTPIPDAAPIEAVVHDVVRQSGEIKVRDLPDDPRVRAELDALRGSLEREGLALTAGEKTAMRTTSLLLWALAIVGFARLWAGISADRAVGFLIAAEVLLVLVCLFFLAAGTMTRGGRATLRVTRERLAHLDPSSSPAWATYGATGAAFGVALFGTTALMSFDPAFAEEAELRNYMSTSGGGGGDSGGGGDGGGGGCGGGGCGGGCGG